MARDSTLDRDVTLFIVSRRHPNVDAMLDAARRVAGLDNNRLCRILDVGSDDEVSYVVEEALDSSHTLAALLSSSPLPAPEVRRIVGEAALVLDIARHRGLHHQQLTPDLVMRTPDGDVKVRGLAMMAALAGIDHVSDQEAARTDAIAVVALAYAGFTGLWPLPGDGGGLPPAPRVASHVAAPSEIATGVPADLDALCRLTFAGDQGPTTPGDFARQIAPWSPIPIMLPTISAPSTQHPHRDDVLAPDLVEPEADSPVLDSPVLDSPELDSSDTASADRDSASDESPGPPDDVHHDPREDLPEDDEPTAVRPAVRPHQQGRGPGGVPIAHRIPSPDGPGRGSQGSGTQGAQRAGPGRPQPTARPPAARGGRPLPPSRPAARPTAQPTARPTARPTAQPPAAADPVKPLGPSPVAEMGAKTAAALGAAGAATAGAAKALGGRISGWSTQAKDRARTAASDVQARREESAAARAAAAQERAAERAERAEQDASATREIAAGDAAGAREPRIPEPGLASPREPVQRDSAGLEPPVPLLPPSAAEPLTRDQSRMAIGIIIGFLVLALGFAMWGVSRIPSLPGLPGGGDETGIASPSPTAGSTETGDVTGSPTDTGNGPPGTQTPGQPLTIADIVDYDPLGDGTERPEELDRITDGDDSTFWGSEGYRNATFSNLKEGVGVVLDLGESSSVSEVTLVLPSAASGSLFVTDDERFFTERPAPDELEPAGDFSGEGSVTSELADGTAGRYVIVWFTEISRSGDWFRARLAEASVTS